MSTMFPAYLTQALQRQFGPALAAEVCAGYPSRRPVTFRVNTLKASAEEVDAALARAGIAARPVSWYGDARIADAAREADLRALPLYADGKIYLQSLSAMVPPLLMPLADSLSVLDMCAAPGGKSTQMMALSGGKIGLTCCERDRLRAERLRHNLSLQGAGRATVMNVDARQLDPLFRFDAILLDAPCTGSGTLLPEPGKAPGRMEEAWVRKIAATQKALLARALRALQPGGTLVYATCSILREENEEAVQSALSAGARLLPVDPVWEDRLPTLPVSISGCLCIRPTELYEGFFVACLQK